MAPIEAGEILGEITIEKDGKVYGSSQLVASSSVGLSYGKYITGKIANTLKKPLVIVFILIILGLLGLYIYTVVRYQKNKKKALQEASRHLSASVRASQTVAASQRQPVLTHRSRSTLANEEIYPDDGKPDMGYGGIDLKQPAETQAERDYFEEFFGKK